MSLEERRAEALRALANRGRTPSPSRFPGETRPSGDMPEYAEAAALFLNGKYIEEEEDDEWWLDRLSGSS